MSGIYKILNILNGKMYIGSSVSFEQRWTQHRSELRRNKHHSPKLQRAWNKYGEDAFVFSIIEECAPEILEKREQFWMDHYNAYGRHGYNIALVAGRAMLGRNHTDEAKAKMSEAGKGKPKSNETKAKLSASQLGKKHTEETKAKISAAAKRRRVQLSP